VRASRVGIMRRAGDALTDTSPPEPRSPTLRAKDRLLRRLLEPVDVASLVYFRIAFAAIMVWECWRYLSKGRIGRYFIEPDFHFTYHGFEWVQPWPGDGMYVHFAVMAVLALMIGLGLLYRLAAFLFFLAFSYVFLLEQATYLNHFYFVILVSVTMIFVPAHRAFSLDAWRRGDQLIQENAFAVDRRPLFQGPDFARPGGGGVEAAEDGDQEEGLLKY